MRIGVLLVAVVVGALPVRAEGPGGCTEPDDPASPVPIAAPTVCHEELSIGDDVDRYALALESGQRIVLRVLPLPQLFWTGLRLRDPAGVEAVCAEAAALDACDVRADVAGIWEIEITREVGEGRYVLSLATTGPHDDCEGGTDAAETVAAARELSLAPDGTGVRSISCDAGRFDALDDRDVFTFVTVSGSVLLVQVTTLAGVTGTMELRDPSGNVDAAGRETVSAQASVSGRWSLSIPRGPAGVSGLPYAFTVTTVQDDCGSSTDAPDASRPLALEEPWSPGRPGARTCSGVLDPVPAAPSARAPADGVDAYAFARTDLDVPSRIEVRAPAGTCIELVLGPDRSTFCDGELRAQTVAGGTSVTFEIAYVSGVGGAYPLHVWGIVPPQADCGVPGDAAGVSEEPRPVSGEQVPSSSLTTVALCSAQVRADDVDVFAVRAPGRASVRAEVAGDVAVPGLCILDATRTCAGTLLVVDLAQDVLVRVSVAGDVTSYTLTVTVIAQDDCGGGADAGDDPSAATTLGTEVCASAVPAAARPPARGRLHPPVDAADWFAVDVLNDVAGLTVTIVPQQVDLDVDVCMVAPTGATVCSASPPGVPEVVAMSACDAFAADLSTACRGIGSWRIGVTHESGPSGAYDLFVVRRAD